LLSLSPAFWTLAFANPWPAEAAVSPWDSAGTGDGADTGLGRSVSVLPGDPVNAAADLAVVNSAPASTTAASSEYCHCLLFVTPEGLPITEYLPEAHEGRTTYGLVLDPTPLKGREGRPKV
jgi:hypothetical protein